MFFFCINHRVIALSSIKNIQQRNIGIKLYSFSEYLIIISIFDIDSISVCGDCGSRIQSPAKYIVEQNKHVEQITCIFLL